MPQVMHYLVRHCYYMLIKHALQLALLQWLSVGAV